MILLDTNKVQHKIRLAGIDASELPTQLTNVKRYFVNLYVLVALGLTFLIWLIGKFQVLGNSAT